MASIGSISTFAMSEAMRLALSRAQVKITEANKEMVSGRHADIGIAIGARTAQAISLRQDIQRLGTLGDTNGALAPRLDNVQGALDALTTGNARFGAALVSARGGQAGTGPAIAEAVATMKDAISHLNSSYGGSHVFGGITGDVPPMTDYFASPAPAARTGVATAFQTAFGMGQGDANAHTITPAQMTAFLDGAFADLFQSPSWETDWSAASDQTTRQRISPREMVDSGVSANETGVRRMMAGLTMIADLGIGSLSNETRAVVLDRAILLTGQSTAGLNDMKTRIGLTQERVTVATERMSMQVDIMTKDLGSLENVDAAEVSTRLSALTTEVETAYALTARLHQLSLVNFL